MFSKLILISILSEVLFAEIPTLLLNNGHRIPIIGLGTSGITEAAVREAIADGYRHIDTSLNYNDSEIIIGKVIKQLIKEGKVKREDLFIVSKVETDYHQRKRVPEGIKKSLKRLQLDYLDLYLIHGPGSTNPANVDVEETWLGMEDVLKANLTRSIGVSNFNEEQLERISAKGKNQKPVTNQVICNPYRNQKKLLSYLTQHNITLTAYSPLGGISDPNLLKDPKLVEIGHKHNVSSAQVALKYQVQRGVIVIPKANTPKYIKQNFDLFGFQLTQQDIKDIEALNKIK